MKGARIDAPSPRRSLPRPRDRVRAAAPSLLQSLSHGFIRWVGRDFPPVLALTLGVLLTGTVRAADVTLSSEVQRLGWVAYSAESPAGDWDLFLMRPDGSQRHPVTDTREFNEAAPRFSPDGARLLYYRIPRSEKVDNNTYGTFELILADSRGAHPQSLGTNYPWASWGAEGNRFACLTRTGIQIVDLDTRRVLRTIPRQGIVQQLVWSPDGSSFVGTANGLGPFWNIGVLVEGGPRIRAVSETERYNCTPDWCPDSRHVLYARGIIGGQEGCAELWRADSDGRNRVMLWAESQRHIYGACASPDGKYLLFTRSRADLGEVAGSGTTMALIRLADAPMLGDDNPSLKAQFPEARPPTWLDLGPGWEPHWTLSETPGIP